MSVMRDWVRYYAAAGDEPRETLLEALKRTGPGRGRQAVDLGCGTGRDARELLRQGWRVLAIDAEPAALEALGEQPGLETRLASFEEADWPEADLVNASFALPFCRPGTFAAVWARIVDSLPAGGYFAGQLFGEHDDWAGEVVTHSPAELDRLLAPFAVEFLREFDDEDRTPLGELKHWHVYHLVARRR